MHKYVAKRLNDGYEEYFSSMSDFSRKYDVGVSSISRILNNKNGTTYARGWTFKKTEEKDFKTVNVKLATYIAKRLSDGYEEKIEHWDKEIFVEKHGLQIKKLKSVLVSDKKIYKENSTVWVFRRDIKGETFPKIKKYTAIRLKDGYEEEFDKIIDFSRKYDLFPTYVSRILRGFKGFKTTKGWTFRKEEI